ncbi:STY4528 family pathogenicity island replication protein [Pseudomonas sp. IT-P2]|uniref:STY4528 family pathogenicity island replication protein n=1 Tax=Pseudomonas sp. IT-P2 TaxID=3026456 RepID=UPI0039DFD0EF
MTNQHSSHTLQAQDAPRSTVLSLMVDNRLTPLDRNCWHVMHSLRSAGGLYTLAGMGQLRSYLACAPLAKRASYETASRALTVLRLTGWISLVGQNSDLMTGNVLNELYQINESALSFREACDLDTTLPALLDNCIDHKHTHLDCIARHIEATREQTSKDNPSHTPSQRDEDDEPPPSRKRPPSTRKPVPSHPATRTSVTQQTDQKHLSTGDSTYKNKYKKIRTYRTRAREERHLTQGPVTLPQCLANAKADQQQDVLAALTRLPPQHRQQVLDELQARSQRGTVRNVVAYFFGLINRALAGEFRPWAGRKKEQKNVAPITHPQVVSVAAEVKQERTKKSMTTKQGRPHFAEMRKIMKGPRIADDLAAQVMKSLARQPLPA